MSVPSKSFISEGLSPVALNSTSCAGNSRTWNASNPAHWASLSEVGLVFGLILGAVWTGFGFLNSCFILLAATSVLAFSMRGALPLRDLGLIHPFRGMFPILISGAVIVIAIRLIGPATLRVGGPAFSLPLGKAWTYVIWALLQEFILQSFFFVRLESVVGSRRAILISALLFAAVHVPSPVLTIASFVGGLLFCELFRRYRNLFPIGVIHGALGLAIAASLPTAWLHHMRVGIGFLSYHQ
jgi:membrane protease YdiL (CAAX protease family)